MLSAIPPSGDAILDRLLQQWAPDHPPGRIREKTLRLDEGGPHRPRRHLIHPKPGLSGGEKTENGSPVGTGDWDRRNEQGDAEAWIWTPEHWRFAVVLIGCQQLGGAACPIELSVICGA